MNMQSNYSLESGEQQRVIFAHPDENRPRDYSNGGRGDDSMSHGE